MAEFPEDPEELHLHYVTVWAKDNETWKPEIDYPDWMSPYEAAGMLRAAVSVINEDILSLVRASDEEEQEGPED